MYLIFEGLTFVSCLGLIAVFLGGFSAAAIVMKSAASVFFLIAGLCGYSLHKQTKYAKPMLAAFFFSAVGDVLLALDKDEGILFVIGVASFAAAHVMFLIVFCNISPIKKIDIGVTAAALVGFIALLLFGNFNYHGLLPVIIGYTIIVSFMMIKALSLWRSREGRKKTAYLIMAGGVLFLLSDLLLLFCLFGENTPAAVQAANWLIYYAAQICLSASFNQKNF